MLIFHENDANIILHGLFNTCKFLSVINATFWENVSDMFSLEQKKKSDETFSDN